MSNTTTVLIPRDLFAKLQKLAAREHRSARGQVLHLITQATRDIEPAAPAAPTKKNTTPNAYDDGVDYDAIVEQIVAGNHFGD